MSVSFKLKSLDEYFHYTEGEKIVINQLAYMDSGDMESVYDKLTTIYNNDIMDTVPRCECGATYGRYNIGRECHECSSVVIDPKDKKKPILWLESLSPELPFINPSFWTMLNNIINKDRNYLRWLVDSNAANPTKKVPNVVLGILQIMDGKRDYKALLDNLDNIFKYLLNSSEMKAKVNYPNLKLCYEIYISNKEDIFSRYMPLPNKNLFVTENTTKGKYTNLVLGDMVDVVTQWMKASTPGLTVSKQIRYTGLVVSKLSTLYVSYFKKFLLGKPGAFRKHVYGGRSHFTFRCVISEAIGKHQHDETTVPWVISLTTFRPHVLNKMITKYGFSYRDATRKITESIYNYDPIIDKIQDELIAESFHPRGIPVVINRNPSLKRGSSQLMYINGFCKNPKTLTATFSPLSAKSPNADYDGDELNFYPLLDKEMHSMFLRFEPHYNIPEIDRPNSVSGRLSLDTPNNTILSNFLNYKEFGDRSNNLYETL